MVSDDIIAEVAKSAFLDWQVKNDSCNVRESALDLRNRSAKYQLEQFSQHRGKTKSDIVFWRRHAIRKFELAIGHPIGGKIIEIGAGTGWCSSELSKRPLVSEVYVLDYEEFCVAKLIPYVHRLSGADESKITRVLGSFNRMQCEDNTFDFVISMGAIHHSENLEQTMAECLRILKPGGYLLALEGCEYNSLSKTDQIRLNDRKINANKLSAAYGPYVKLCEGFRERDNSNRSYRLLDYEYCALEAGFNLRVFLFDDSPAGGFVRLWARIIKSLILRDVIFSNRNTHRGFYTSVLYPYFARGAYILRPKKFDRLMMMARKATLPNAS